MPTQSSSWTVGYLATPILEAFRRRGLFRILDSHGFRERDGLASELGADAGHMAVALEVLELLGWIERNEAGAYRRTGSGPRDLDSFELTPLYATDPLQPEDPAIYVRTLVGKLADVVSHPVRGEHDWPALAQGALALPLALMRGTLGADVFERLLDGCVPARSESLAQILDAPGDDALRGAASYRVLLHGAEELLFGDAQRAWTAWRESRRSGGGVGLPESLRRALEGEGSSAEDREPPFAALGDDLGGDDADVAAGGSPAWLVAEQPSHYLDPRGALLDAGRVLSAWSRYFDGLATDAGRARRRVLAAHAAPPGWRGPDAGAAAFLDVVRRLAREHAVTAGAFITLAASRGLYDDVVPRRHPQGPGPCELSLHDLVRRDYTVRPARESDVGRLWEIEQACWRHTRTPEARLLARVRQYPQGQFVLEKEGALVGVIYSQRISTTDALEGRTADDVHELHRATGPVGQVLALNIDPRVQDQGLGDQLLEFFLQHAALCPGVERVVGVTLCKSYRDDGSRDFDDYLRLQGAAQDPVLAFHQSHGAQIVAALEGYRPEDRANGGRGVLVAYDLAHRAPRPQAQASRAPGSAAAAMEPGQVDEWVRREVADLLRVSEGDVAVDRPLMEMGLDSADLLALQQRCEERFARRLGAGFFFEHSTCARVAAFLAATSSGVPDAGGAPTTRPHAGGPARPPRRPARPAAVDDARLDRDVAIVGVACRLPGGIETPGQLGQLLAAGGSAIGKYPEARGRWASGTSHPGIDRGGFIPDLEAFDAAFFRMSPAEAQRTDPQQRMLLETAWACLEDACIAPEQWRGTRTGVFVGASNGDYGRLVQDAGLEVEAHHGVGSALAVIANRISYFFDWCGPSLLIDTACSSSLVALHAALQALRAGECDAALVGGVNVICHPDLSIAYHKAGMLAPDGRCKVFDAAADGYVRSEGAVTLLLKPMRRALADEDQVHAVIRGSAINHGGLAAGLTVPNPGKQSELLQAAWANAGIAAHELTYIEAHGTGTALGDPIEVEGILGAYAAAAGGRRSSGCGIGSVKSNLGHLESAAGLAGLLKVIVAMQRRELPATIHFERLNPKIRIEGSFLRVQERRSSWDAEGPLVAGVSSFGSGGANAHVVVQEHVQRERECPPEQEHLFVLSARDHERLRAHAEKVTAWLAEHAPDGPLADAIYSWQVGRAGMTQRLAVRTRDREHLSNKLKQWLEGGRDLAGVWHGAADSDATGVGRVWRSAAGRQLIDRALIERDLEQLAVLWTSGAEVDWRRLHQTGAGAGPRRRSVPTYPFARERYWIDRAATGAGAARRAAVDILHPVLHRNTSDLAEQRYTSTFTGEELFFAGEGAAAEGDAATRSVLPALVYLEMARAAVEHACPERPAGALLELRDVAWTGPVAVAPGTRISIALSEGEDERVDYEIYGDEAREQTVHCTGRAVWTRAPAPARLDLEAIAASLATGSNGASDAPACSMTARRQVDRQALTTLRLPVAVTDHARDWVLHPSLIAGALQSWSDPPDAAAAVSDRTCRVVGVDVLRIVAPCREEMVAWVRPSSDTRPGDDTRKLDIELCDAGGNVCVQIEGLATSAAGTDDEERLATDDTTGCLMAIPAWRGEEITASAGSRPAESIEHHVIACELPQAGGATWEALLPGSRCISLPASDGRTLGERYVDHALTCFERVQSILQSKPRGTALVQLVVAGDAERSVFAGLSGLLRTAAAECPWLAGQVILVPADLAPEEIAARLRRERDGGRDVLVRYEGAQRQVQRWEELAAAEEPPFALPDRGVYLITGGLGGLGIVFAREILERTREARVALTGRSALSAEKRLRLESLPAAAGRVGYRRLDLGDLADVERVVGDVQAEHGPLSGILHCAGMIADSVILKKSSAQFRDVLAPKVTGTCHLDHATRGLELDSFVLFSSINSAIGNPGQADYAAANGFMDEFAAYRNGQVAAGARRGRTRSIHWPLWQAGGMQVDAATRAMLEQTTGVRPLRTATGLRAFQRVLASPHARVVVAEGVTSKIAACLRRASVLAPLADAAPAVASDLVQAGSGPARLQEQFTAMLAGVLRVEAAAIDPDRAFAELGLDSFLGTALIVAVNKRYGTALSNTRIYDHPTARAFASMLAQEVEQAPASPSPARPRGRVARGATRRPRAGARQDRHLEEQVAVVGMAGRYPGARNLAEYWRNLAQGRNSIVEVPASRWDVARYYDPDRTRKDKTVSKWLGALDDIECFDPLFFRISPQEAEYMDPQHRLFLQEGYRAFEDAGYSGAALSESRCGVYLGITTNEYLSLLSRRGIRPPITSNSYAIAAGRIAYHLNLKGPAIPIDTACSSSLVAMHLACRALLDHEIDLALAGGVTLYLGPESFVAMSQAGMLSATGQCRPFDDGADGIVNGEGVGTVVLKRLRDAQADNDHIYGVVLGSGVNQDGRTNGITAPSVNSQIELARGIYAKYGIDPESISYVEAHGTGTPLGDPIELEALAAVFGEKTTRKRFCGLGSVKSNIGHTTAAAGVAGVHKVLLSMRHATLAASLNVSKETTRFDFANSPFYVCRETRAWDAPPGARRLAAVSSFGFSGTNAHMVIGEYVAPERRRALAVITRDARPVVVPLSARKPEQLREKAAELCAFVREAASAIELTSLAYTLQVGRDAMEERVCLVVDSLDELTAKLEAFVAAQREIEGVHVGQAKRHRERVSEFGSDEELRDAVESWISAGRRTKVAELWAAGFDFDWSRLYGSAAPARIGLPTYPFARERYWIPEVETAAAGARRVSTGPAGETWGEYWRAHDALLVKVLWSQLRSLGLLAEAALSVEGWKATAGLPSMYERWLDETMRLLAERGHLSYDGQSCQLTAPVTADSASAWDEWNRERERWSRDPHLRAPGLLVETTLRALPEILTGRRPATEIVFPGASMELVEGIYKNNAQADYFNEVLADALAAHVERRRRLDPDARVRILEIGAGTGGSTATLLRRLEAHREGLGEYCYSDVSRAFLLHGEEHYGSRHPFLSFRLFDVEKPPGAQGIDVGGYDAVVATNVLHATRNIRRTLRNARAALRPGGRLFLNEMAESSLYLHLTFGLLEGWWLYEDPELRIRGCPALDPRGWKSVLEEEGFRSVAFVAEEALALGQQVLVAESDGITRPGPHVVDAEPAGGPEPAPSLASVACGASDASGMNESIHAFLVAAVSEMMKLKLEDIDLDAELSEIGFDSITLTGFSRHLNKALGLELEPSIFFEHPTLRGFAAYLAKAHPDALGRRFHLWRAGSEGAADEPRPRAAVAGSADAAAGSFPRPSAVGRPAPLEPPRPETADAVAIIGMSGCFPYAEDVDALWRNLLEGRDCIREIPEERWDWRALPGGAEEAANRPDLKWAGLIDGVDEFDPLFFGISPREAELMDPQQRLLMTHVWKAVEDAGYSPQSLAGTSTALLVGTLNSGYSELINRSQSESRGESATGMVPSIGPNRMSYLLDLHGPSEPIETACSSSLVALHRGRELILGGQCDMAIVGGVNALVSPESHLSFSKAGMLSPDGRCKTFSAAANGYVRGEGAGILVLKKLSAAERDGDHVYGVLRGSTENHGGRANSLTAPNPKAQTALIQGAYAQAGIDCRSVGYIEAHGTGTALGDPVEINGLKSAFQELYALAGAGEPASAHCGLGSIKSNIGHLELAAGAAGVIKVLLQMQHRTLVKTLHCDEVNPYIRLEGSPFYVVRENRAWEAPRDEQGRELPRRAGVSSFGFGGVNAHVVLEEYVPVPRPRRAASGPVVVVLSARNEERLREQARRLHAAIAARGLGDSDLADLAYTLQVGREAMEHRLALVARSIDEVQHKLEEFVAGKPAIEDVYRGELKRNKDALTLFKADDELQEAVSKWIERGKLSKLLALWVKGLEFDWNRLYGDEKPRRLSLPAYPFARERCWFEAPADQQPAVRHAAGVPVLHPLLHSNTSDLHEQRYSSTFSGEEFFLVDHRVRTDGRTVEKVLPGAAFLEMARAAVERSLPLRNEAAVLELRDVVWAHPVVVGESRIVHIGLQADDGEEVDYEIYSGEADERVVHGQGRAAWARQPLLATLDLDEIRGQIGSATVAPERVYAAFGRRGFVQGPAFRVITGILQGATQSLTRLRLSPHAAGRWGEYVLHPSVMDGALQACAGLLDGWSDDIDQPRVPFALDLLRVVLPCSPEMEAWVRYSPGQAGGKLVKLDLDLCDEDGNVCVQMRGLASRFLGGAARPSEPLAAKAPVSGTRVAPGAADFDGAFYRQLIADMLNGDITVDEAADLG